ncbi:MAG: stage II sporulation protein R [Bacillus sp. (in: firmicutes)]
MKSKVIVWGYLIVLSLGTMLSLYMPKTEAAAKESIVIPGEAIRLRILANSDFEEDQAIKRKVRDAVNAQISLWVQDLTSMQEARKVINSKLPEIQAIAEQVVREQKSDQSVKVEFGKVQFPTKLYGQFLYPAGEYQAILITLGSGEGANWWCVLYPPLCFLDFSNGVAASQGFDEPHKAQAKTVNPKKEVAVKRPKANQLKEKAVTFTAPKVDSEINKDTVVAKEADRKISKATVKAKEDDIEINKETDEQVAVVSEKEIKRPETMVEKDTFLYNEPVKSVEKEAPVYTAEDEKPVEVKFFVVEMWHKMFN